MLLHAVSINQQSKGIYSLLKLGNRFREHLSVARHLNLPNHFKQHTSVYGLPLHQGSTESQKTIEQKFSS